MKNNVEMEMLNDYNNIMGIDPLTRLPVILAALDYTLAELDMSIEDVLKMREDVIKICGEVILD